MHDSLERLNSYADILADELPGTWTSQMASDAEGDLAELADRLWDLDLVAASLAVRPLVQAAVLNRPDGAQLVLLDPHDVGDSYLVAAVAPLALPDEAYRGVVEPDGIAVPQDDPFQGAELTADGLLDRYDTALAQVRNNALGHIQPPRSDRVVLTWQQDGSVATAPVTTAACAVLEGAGFRQDPHTGIHWLSGDDTTVQARVLQAIGPQLDALGISTALQHSERRTAPTAAACSRPVAPAPRTPATRAR
ncbi:MULTISPECIES: hypothetical protein [unclassified Streptomyces]|uniref:hypothetical protein n=1 Tax=unclassified Streptomyces TaxID=2593676 RepID=UPI003632E915